jgi:hypothetical protein
MHKVDWLMEFFEEASNLKVSEMINVMMSMPPRFYRWVYF